MSPWADIAASQTLPPAAQDYLAAETPSLKPAVYFTGARGSIRLRISPTQGSSMPLPNLRIPHAIALALSLGLSARGQTPQVDVVKLRQALHFHAPFDNTADAQRFTADGKIMTADSTERKRISEGIRTAGVSIAPGEGKFGDCLRFTQKTDQVLMFAGREMHHAPENWSGTVSLWLRLNPDQDLPPGFCDPLQITDKAWNDAAFFVDFDKDLPRDFRLGAFSNLSHWNPKNISWDAWPIEKRPMVTVKQPPFSRDAWTHVAFTFDRINPAAGESSQVILFVNGKPTGTLEQPMRFSWDVEKAAIMLGIYYVGDLDDLMIFNRALSPAEINHLHSATSSL